MSADHAVDKHAHILRPLGRRHFHTGCHRKRLPINQRVDILKTRWNSSSVRVHTPALGDTFVWTGHMWRPDCHLANEIFCYKRGLMVLVGYGQVMTGEWHTRRADLE